MRSRITIYLNFYQMKGVIIIFGSLLVIRFKLSKEIFQIFFRTIKKGTLNWIDFLCCETEEKAFNISKKNPLLIPFIFSNQFSSLIS